MSGPGTTITFTQPTPDPNVCGVVYYVSVPMSRCTNAKPCANHPQTPPLPADDDHALRLARRLHELSAETGPQFGLTATRTDFSADDRFGHFLIAISRVLLHEFVDVPAAHEVAQPLHDIAAFGSEVLRHILTDTSFFESEESEQWCELLERHGYVERAVWNSAKHGESNVLGDGDEAWIFTEKMRRDAAGLSVCGAPEARASSSDETPTIAYWRRNAHEALDAKIAAAIECNINETPASVTDRTIAAVNVDFFAQQAVNHVTNARFAKAAKEPK